jgi:hypothetical protein
MVAMASLFIGKRPIFSNMSVPWAEPFTSWEQLVGLADGICMLDEAMIWFNSRNFGKFPPEVLSFLAQSRKNGVDMMFTAQSFMGVDTNFRRLTATRYQCDRYGPLIVEKSFDGQSDEYLGKRYRLLNKRIFDLYDTWEVVGNVDGSDAGVGRMSQAALDRAVKYALQGGLVRVEEFGTVAYRPAVLDDLREGRELIERVPGVGLRVLPRHRPQHIADMIADGSRASAASSLTVSAPNMVENRPTEEAIVAALAVLQAAGEPAVAPAVKLRPKGAATAGRRPRSARK